MPTPDARLDPRPDWLTDPATRAVLAPFQAAWVPVRFVGGCVRNALLGLPPGDLDLATPLVPDGVMALARAAGLGTVPTGLAHGTVTLLADGRRFEVTTLRRDVSTDGRRATVAFAADWREDAVRRDLTMNALYAEADGAVFDPLGAGLADLAARRVRFVGEPGLRIREDVLRLLRFYRFTARYGHGIDAAGQAACAAHAHLLPTLSPERVRAELLNWLGAPDPLPTLRAAASGGVLDRLPVAPADPDRLARLRLLSDDPLLRLAALGHRAGAAALAAGLRLSNDEAARVRGALSPLPPGWRGGPAEARRLAAELGVAATRDRLLLAATAPDGPDPAPALAALAGWSPPEPPIKGRDLLEAGLPPGPLIGRTLDTLLAAWRASDFALDRAALLERARTLHAAEGAP